MSSDEETTTSEVEERRKGWGWAELGQELWEEVKNPVVGLHYKLIEARMAAGGLRRVEWKEAGTNALLYFIHLMFEEDAPDLYAPKGKRTLGKYLESVCWEVYFWLSVSYGLLFVGSILGSCGLIQALLHFAIGAPLILTLFSAAALYAASHSIGATVPDRATRIKILVGISIFVGAGIGSALQTEEEKFRPPIGLPLGLAAVSQWPWMMRELGRNRRVVVVGSAVFGTGFQLLLGWILGWASGLHFLLQALLSGLSGAYNLQALITRAMSEAEEVDVSRIHYATLLNLLAIEALLFYARHACLLLFARPPSPPLNYPY